MGLFVFSAFAIVVFPFELPQNVDWFAVKMPCLTDDIKEIDSASFVGLRDFRVPKITV